MHTYFTKSRVTTTLNAKCINEKSYLLLLKSYCLFCVPPLFLNNEIFDFLMAFPFLSLFNLLQLVFGGCKFAVLHYCVVIIFWFSGIMDCMWCTFKIRVSLMR